LGKKSNALAKNSNEMAKNSNLDRYEEQQFGQACDSDGSWVDVFELNVIKR